ncbi:hypothetical protein POSPLADRAFT_1056984 [Postia placenta MAD-698-R-SB12]|uniref:F-box domain-containing protein n=1 Tax=Postia placenta MAD-698-R-SB12 TaxID=670580 RepID=A0A1X6N1K6_9APHY|nr:hypothetical protein POSPLADRAFT_1056984 [Postia placenta MAD-698-R-SB12]OSX62390.1 hypothetical protein POSPLADRAFT_1056984 [Postia placenta MAD-698-R-SB12]
MQISEGSSLPVELWMHILDDVAEEQNYDAIARCARVCRFFEHMCKKHLQDDLTFSSEEGVEHLKTDTAEMEIGGWRGPQFATIVGERDSKAIPHVATFASRFAGRWTQIWVLTIENASWPSSLRAANAAVFRDLSRLASITRLVLEYVTFPSIVTFGALVSALPRLERLHLRDVTLTGSSGLFDPRTLAEFRLLPPTKNLQHITLGHVSDYGSHKFIPSAWPCYTELLAFIVAVSNPCGKSPRVYPWGSVCNLRLDENVWWKFSSSSIARLLHALPSLENLKFATADSTVADLEITGLPAHPRLEPIAIGVHCATAQSQHVARIIRCLIDMDFPLTVMRIYATVYPFLRDAHRLVATAINELVHHAGPSLDDLGVFLQGDRYDSVIPIDAAADRYRRCDLFANTNPTSLRIYGCDASCLGVREILSHVTSRCVASVNIHFRSLERRDRGELGEGLSQLDTVLLLPVFDNLLHVLIWARFPQFQPQAEMEKWAHSMKSSMSSLDERRVLGIELRDEDSRHRVRLGLIWDHDIEDWRRYDSRMDENGNVEIAEVPASEGRAPSEAMAAHTAWKRSSQTQGDRRSAPEPEWQAQPQRWMTEVTARGRAYEEEARGVKGI